MQGVNKVILLGHLGKDPEVQYFEGGLTRVRFSLATSELQKDKEGKQFVHTEWHHIVLWRNIAEQAEKTLKKGSLIHLEGKLRSREWLDKQGKKQYVTEIVGDSFVLVEKKEATPQEHEIEPPTITGMDGGSSDLPF
jgi:single-strand DNA-binding protein